MSISISVPHRRLLIGIIILLAWAAGAVSAAPAGSARTFLPIVRYGYQLPTGNAALLASGFVYARDVYLATPDGTLTLIADELPPTPHFEPLQFSPDGDYFIYRAGNSDGNPTDFFIASVGDPEFRVPIGGSDVPFDAGWMPDSSSVYYLARNVDAGYRPELFLLDLATGQRSLLAINIERVIPHPDNEHIIYSTPTSPYADNIYRVNRDGDITPLAVTPADEYLSAVLADGRVLFSVVGYPSPTPASGLWVMNSDGSNPHRLTINHDPDTVKTAGNQILVHTITGLRLIDTEGALIREYTVPCNAFQCGLYEAVWRPELSEIFFVIQGNGWQTPTEYTLYRAYISGLGSLELIRDGAYHVAISPDGRHLGYLAILPGGDRVVLTDLDTGASIFDPGALGLNAFFGWRPGVEAPFQSD